MNSLDARELEREYRVLRMVLSMHAMLRDEFARKARASELLLLACAVVFCSTTFASDELYKTFGLAPNISRAVVGIASIAAFALSLTLLVLDWRGRSARHGDAVSRWSDVLAKYRNSRNEDGTWPQEIHKELSAAYWEADRNSVEIPDRRFNGLKARHLRKVAISDLQSSYPGCPRLVLAAMLRVRDTAKATNRIRSEKVSS